MFVHLLFFNVNGHFQKGRTQAKCDVKSTILSSIGWPNMGTFSISFGYDIFISFPKLNNFKIICWNLLLYHLTRIKYYKINSWKSMKNMKYNFLTWEYHQIENVNKTINRQVQFMNMTPTSTVRDKQSHFSKETPERGGKSETSGNIVICHWMPLLHLQ